MSNHVPEAERDANARALERYIESFTTSLSERGYCAPVVGQKRAMVACFARWMGRRRIAAYKIDEATVSAFLAHLSRRGSLIGNRRFTLMAFLDHLRDQAVTDRPKPVRDDSPPTLLLQNYQTYLRKEQGLTEETADNYLRFVSPLVRTCLLGSATGTVGGNGVAVVLAISVSARGDRRRPHSSRPLSAPMAQGNCASLPSTGRGGAASRCMCQNNRERPS